MLGVQQVNSERNNLFLLLGPIVGSVNRWLDGEEDVGLARGVVRVLGFVFGELRELGGV